MDAEEWRAERGLPELVRASSLTDAKCTCPSVFRGVLDRPPYPVHEQDEHDARCE